jgi:hypothetical protein
MADGPLSAEAVAEFLARCRDEWVAGGFGEHASPAVLDRVAAIVTADLLTEGKPGTN